MAERHDDHRECAVGIREAATPTGCWRPPWSLKSTERTSLRFKGVSRRPYSVALQLLWYSGLTRPSNLYPSSRPPGLHSRPTAARAEASTTRRNCSCSLADCLNSQVRSHSLGFQRSASIGHLHEMQRPTDAVPARKQRYPFVCRERQVGLIGVVEDGAAHQRAELASSEAVLERRQMAGHQRTSPASWHSGAGSNASGRSSARNWRRAAGMPLALHSLTDGGLIRQIRATSAVPPRRSIISESVRGVMRQVLGTP